MDDRIFTIYENTYSYGSIPFWPPFPSPSGSRNPGQALGASMAVSCSSSVPLPHLSCFGCEKGFGESGKELSRIFDVGGAGSTTRSSQVSRGPRPCILFFSPGRSYLHRFVSKLGPRGSNLLIHRPFQSQSKANPVRFVVVPAPLSGHDFTLTRS